MKFTTVILWASLLVSLAACSRDDSTTEWDNRLNQQLREASQTGSMDYFLLPDGRDLSEIPQDPNNPLTKEKVALGKMLFHETGLADDAVLTIGQGTYSCASCHHADVSFFSGIRQGISEGGQGYGVAGEGRRPNPAYYTEQMDILFRRPPSVANIAYQEVVLWSGELGGVGPNLGTEAQWSTASHLNVNYLGYEGAESQAITGLDVHRMTVDEYFFEKYPEYRTLMDEAFPDLPEYRRYSNEGVGLAIAAYERTVLTNQSPFQRWLRGDNSALTERQKAGAMLFFGDAGCVQCHTGPALNSMEFHAIGLHDLDIGEMVGEVDEATRKGRGGFTGKPEDDYKFKVPQLYNLDDAPMCGHGASMTLEEIIAYKSKGVPENPNVPKERLAPNFTPLNLTGLEQSMLVEFIKVGLYDPNLSRYTPASVISGNCFPVNDEVSKRDMGCDGEKPLP